MTLLQHAAEPTAGLPSTSVPSPPPSPPASMKLAHSPKSFKSPLGSPKEPLQTCTSGNHLLDLRSPTRSSASPTNGHEDEEVQHLINPYNLHLRIDAIRGRGVFTSIDIPAGTLLEESPVLVLKKEEWEDGKMNDTILGEYGICWANGGMAIGLGLASLFNHSRTPNVNFIRNTKTNTISFRAFRRIKAGEELCICYAVDETKLWFVTTSPPRNDWRDALDEHGLKSPEAIIFPAVDPDDLYDVQGTYARRKERANRTKDLENGIALRLPPHSPESSLGLRKSSLSIPPQPVTPAIISPKPIHFASLPSIPPPDSSDLTPLPPPLHSTPTPSPNIPTDQGDAEITADLDWRAEDWQDKEGLSEETDINCVRIKGPTEIEEDRAEAGMLDIWVVDIDEPHMNREILMFLKEAKLTETCMKHLKRVVHRPSPDGSGESTSIAICTRGKHSLEQLTALMTGYHPSIGRLVPRMCTVPSAPARSAAESREKNQIWPVSLSPLNVRPTSSSQWTVARREWVKAGMTRIMNLALEAKDRGELPVGVFCASAPEAFWPNNDGFIPPTAGLRAQSTDTRTSAKHPLRHAVLNCVRCIAHLRTVPPFSTAIPTRNGSDYLLTSLSLFITHEPCVMCCMALLHSRVREVFYIFPAKMGGGFEGGMGIHGRKDLNHKYDVWKYDGNIDEGVRKSLELEDGVAV